MSDSIWDKLSAINVNDHTEKKGNLTYLSWAWAWGIVKKECPDATYRVDIGLDGKPFLFDENLGYMVQTTVTIEGESIPMHLFVMDGANKAQKHADYTYDTKHKKDIICKAATMFDINTAIMRCLTKNLSMFGLGHYIYAGEDMPDGAKEQAQQENDLITYNADVRKVFQSIAAVKDFIYNEDLENAAESWFELTREEKLAIWKAPSKGGVFTTREIEVIKSDQFCALNPARQENNNETQ